MVLLVPQQGLLWLRQWLSMVLRERWKVFGTPGEEGFSGKAFMAPEGIFDVADVVLDWHPGSGASGVSYSSNTARVSFRANFYGTRRMPVALPIRDAVL